jgi:ferric-dicitrate binding protein FerR (iron transport regulator)
MQASSPDPLYVAELVTKHLQGELTDGERVWLDAWIAADEKHQRLWLELNDTAMQQYYARSIARYDEAPALERFMKKHATNAPSSIPLRARLTVKWKWAVAAASVIAVVAMTGYLWSLRGPAAPVVTVQSLQDVAPGRNGAILMLSNGERVLLDSLQNGVVATQKGSQAILTNGGLVYHADDEQTGEAAYNTILVPNGRQFHLTLPDGTQAWLNSASSIRYPVAFNGTQRQVEITGEAYFEVTKDKSKPFRVTVRNRVEVEVLGTHFNVNAYDNEEALSTTLLEGSVRVSTMHAGPSGSQYEHILQPGQQMLLSEKRVSITEADVDKVIAWKNGLFNFDEMDLKNAMKQIARWYDVEIVYRGEIPDIKFYGRISREVSLSGLIKGLQGAGVHMMIENGKQLVVMP